MAIPSRCMSATNCTPTFAHHPFRRLSYCCKRIPSSAVIAFVHATVLFTTPAGTNHSPEPCEHWWRTPEPKRLCVGGVAHHITKTFCVHVLYRWHFKRMKRHVSCHALRDRQLAYGACPDVKLAYTSPPLNILHMHCSRVRCRWTRPCS